MDRRQRNIQMQLLCGAAMAVVSLGQAHADDKIKFAIPPQPLSSALTEFGQQSGISVIAPADLTASKKSSGFFTSADPDTALKNVLAGTGLTYKRQGELFAIVVAANDGTRRTLAPATVTTAAAETVTGSAIEGLTVTAQKRSERIQDVPIAISAFSADALQAQKIEGGFDLLKAIPNVTFSKNNFTSYNFSIRGIGTKAISAATDPGVAVAFNNSGIIQNRLFEQEYFDVERVEVLRGPQGTLYGRNATSGVINLISNKAQLDAFDGSIKGEVGNYHTKRLSGMINVPLIEDVLGVRFAGSLTSREGYDFNTVTDNPVNGRDIWSGRLSIGFQPTEAIRADFIWERFNEDDDRLRTGKQLCHHDDGLTRVGNTDTVQPNTDALNTLMRPTLFSQGCKAGSLYDDAAFGTPNGLALPFIFGVVALGNDPSFNIGIDEQGNPVGLLQLRDPYGGMMQSRDLREIASFRDPHYTGNADLFELNVDWDVTDSLTFSSQTLYNEDQVYSFQDYNRFNTLPVFIDTSQVLEKQPGLSWANLAPGGVFCDPQLGCSDTMAGFDISKATAEQFSQEFRLQSAYDGPFNFSTGVNYTTFDVLVDYYVMFNLLSAYSLMQPFNQPFEGDVNIEVCGYTGFVGITNPIPQPSTNLNAPCPYIDPNPVESINGEGHNYFRSKNPYNLRSWAAFGETYYQITDKLKLTLGLRYTHDEKVFTPVPSQLLLAPGFFVGGTVSRGYPEKPDIEQEWGEWTGRLGLDWQPDLSFTDETLLYAFYSRGYKGGGANPPKPGFATEDEIRAIAEAENDPFLDNILDIVPLPILELTADEYGDTFDAEFVNAFEIGTKNTLFGGGMTLNVTGFYYDYKNYQVSQIRDRTAVNENFDAKVWGLEFETMFAPSEDFQIIANVGYLDTEIADGETSIDIMNRTQGDPGFVLVKPWLQLPSNCVVPVHIVESYLLSDTRITSYWNLCRGIGGLLGLTGLYPVPNDPNFNNDPYDVANYPILNGGAGLAADLGGNELPNAPHFTANLGAQYSWDLLGGDWSVTVRGDAYWQSQSWARVYNLDQYDKLHGWYNANIAFWIEKPEEDLKIEFYVKNVFDDTPITDAFLNSDDTGLTTNVFVLDPRLIGVSVTKGF